MPTRLCRLDHAEAITLSQRRGDGAPRQAPRKNFDEQVVVELTALIAFQTMSSKFNSASDVPARDFCHIPLPDSGEGSRSLET